MASIAQLIGNRPAAYSVGQGLGEAMKEGSKYYGELAVQKLNAEKLEQARRYDEKRTADDRTYQAGVRAEQTEHDDAQHASDLTVQQARIDAENAREDAQRDEDLANGALTDTIDINGVPHKVRLDTNGNIVKDLGPDRDYVVDDEGRLGRLSAGQQGAAPGKRTEAQIKYGIHERNLNSGLRVIEGVLGQGYDLQSFEAFSNQVLGLAGAAGNWATTPKGRAYRTGVIRASEALFKGESGAAGSDNEAARYQSMFPAPGDDPNVVQLKFLMLDEARKAFIEASGLNRDDQVMYARSMADSVAAENGFAITDGGFEPLQAPNAESTPGRTYTPSQQSLLDKYGSQ